MSIETSKAGIVIVGAGPAGIAAAVSAAACGKRVTILDDNPAEGGQIWRGGRAKASTAKAARWFAKLKNSGVTVHASSRLIDANSIACTLRVETANAALTIEYGELILATGARELFLPFPGWTLPNVMGAGGLQGLVKSGLPVKGKRVVVAGSGPLLMAVASQLRKHGAIVPMIVEQANLTSLARFGVSLGGHPGKLWQAITLKASLGSTSYMTGSWVKAAEGEDKVNRIQIQTGSKIRTVDCDYLAVAYGFTPNTELAQLLHCNMKNGFAAVDDYQRTSAQGIFCAGELTGLGGVDLSLVEGEIAGYAASGRDDLARKRFPVRERARQFADGLNRTFSLRPELRALPDSQTIVCRCEDVRYGTLRQADCWRAAKLHHRCGMGPCQGRICGPATQFIFGWKQESVRPPVFPARISSLVLESTYTIEEGVNK